MSALHPIIRIRKKGRSRRVTVQMIPLKVRRGLGEFISSLFRFHVRYLSRLFLSRCVRNLLRFGTGRDVRLQRDFHNRSARRTSQTRCAGRRRKAWHARFAGKRSMEQSNEALFVKRAPITVARVLKDHRDR